MRFFPKAVRATAAAAAMAAAAITAGCASGSPAPEPASAHPLAATASRGAMPPRAVPPVFAVSFAPATAGRTGDRLALASSRTGDLVRWLTPQPQGASDQVLSVRDGWVYFVRYPAGPPNPAIWRVRVTGGGAQLVRSGAADYAVSPDGRAVAYVTSADHGDVLDLVARNLVTGRRNTIILATKPSPGANNWPPDVSSLTWAPDDVHLAVQVSVTAALNRVLVFDAFTAATAGDGRTAPAPCPVDAACGEFDPEYLASGALTYLIQRISRSGTASASLVAWKTGHRTTLVWIAAGTPASYDMTAQGQAIWVTGPVRPKGPSTIWRWSGGAPVRIATLPSLGASPYYGVGAIAW
jgi:hypothetical protein